MVSGFIDESEGVRVSGALNFGRPTLDSLPAPAGRIVGVIGLLFVLCGCLWAIAEYAEQKAEIRRAETDRYIQAFEAGPVADAWAKLRGTWDALDARAYGFHAGVLEPELEAEIGIVLGYFRGFALCVRAGNCDLERARVFLGDRPLRFHDQHQEHLKAHFPAVPFARDLQTLMPKESSAPAGP